MFRLIFFQIIVKDRLDFIKFSAQAFKKNNFLHVLMANC